MLGFLLALAASAQQRQVAITFDDLPRGGDTASGRDLESIRAMTVKLTDALRGVPVIAFVNAGRVPELGDAGLQSILKIWVGQAADLGNHTYSHPNINQVSLREYTDDLSRGEPAIRAALGHKPVYFRHPFCLREKMRQPSTVSRNFSPSTVTGRRRSRSTMRITYWRAFTLRR